MSLAFEPLVPRRDRTLRRQAASSAPLEIPQFGPLTAAALERLARLTGGMQLIPAGSYLVRHGHPFYDLYAVRSGRIQAVVTNAAGYRRVLKEYRPGEVIGLTALVRGTYPADFIALESATLCPVPLHMVEGLGAEREVRSPGGLLTRLSRRLHAKLPKST